MELILIPLVLIADQLTKYLIAAHYQPGDYKELIPGVLDLRYVRNTGAAYSMFTGKTAVLAAVTLVLIGGLCFYLIREKKNMTFWERIGLISIISGGAGNLIDRVIRGFVVDFVDIHIIPVFNVADMFITCGAAVLVIAVIISEKKKTKEKDE